MSKLHRAQSFRLRHAPQRYAFDAQAFPSRVGEHHLTKVLGTSSLKRIVSYAVYANRRGERVFAKRCLKMPSSIHYFWFRYEMHMLRLVTHLVKTRPELYRAFPRIRVPLLREVYTDRSAAIMLMSYVAETNAPTLSPSAVVKRYERVVGFVSRVGELLTRAGTSNIVKRNRWYLAAIFPIILLRAVWRDRSLGTSVPRLVKVYAESALALLTDRRMKLVHRDIGIHNVVCGKGTTWLLDFEHIVVTHPYCELAAIAVGLFCYQPEAFAQWQSGSAMADVMSTAKNRKLYRYIAAYVGLYNMVTGSAQERKILRSYLEHTLNLGERPLLTPEVASL